MIFEDRVDAGRQLAEALEHYKGQDVIVLAVPRGGVVVGYEVARALNAPLDVVIPRKIGAPGQPELAIGAVAIDEKPFLDHQMIHLLGVSQEYIEAEVRRQKEEIERRRKIYRSDRPFPKLKDKTVILVDDGIATGYTMMAAIHAIRRMQPSKLILAVPVAPPEAVSRLRPLVDELIVLETPEPFFSVGSWYEQFEQTTDEEVIELLKKAETEHAASQQPPS